MNTDFLSQIEARLPEFSKAQKLIARYILDHYEKAAFMTASRLGATVGVSESTVVRFASEVGCDGYPQLQKGLQEIIRNRLTSVQRMEITNDQIGRNNVASKVLSMDIERIKQWRSWIPSSLTWQCRRLSIPAASISSACEVQLPWQDFCSFILTTSLTTST